MLLFYFEIAKDDESEVARQKTPKKSQHSTGNFDMLTACYNINSLLSYAILQTTTPNNYLNMNK